MGSIMSSSISPTTLNSKAQLQSWRERPPSSYSIKVQNFSKLQSSALLTDGKYKSRYFTSDGNKSYKWRLIIYPKGNDKDNGSGFISMYVEIDTTRLNSKTPTEVFADLRFFVYNKKENKYFTIQDVESKPFSALRTVWGLPQVLALDIFKDREKGYLFDGDHCEFGVDIVVTRPPSKWEILSLEEKLPFPKFSWTVKNVSEIKQNPRKSNSFPMGGRNWVLELYKGRTTEDNKWLSIYLHLAEGEILKEDEKIYVLAGVKLLDPRGSNHLAKKFTKWFDKPGIAYGWSEYVSIAELRKFYLDKEDTLNVEFEFEVLSATKYSSFT